MKVSRKELLSMIEEEAVRTRRLQENPTVRNVKEPLNAEELDMLDLLLTRADLYGEIPSGHDGEVFGLAADATAELYKAAMADGAEASDQGDRGNGEPWYDDKDY
jgi:hypothetical protein